MTLEPAGEIPLEGGNTTAGVVRVGDTVRRPVRAASERSRAVLRHLEEVGFPHAPRFLGIDEQGREILSFVPGRTIWPHEMELLADGRVLEPIGALVRAYHEAMASFRSAGGDDEDDRLVLHGDLAPWNVVVGDDGTWTLIDWDEVATGDLAWELAYVLHTFIPLWPNTPFADDDAEIRRRIGRFAAAYGAEAALVERALRLVPERGRWLADATEARAAGGDASYRRLVAEGHPQVWRDAANHVAGRLAAWGVEP